MRKLKLTQARQERFLEALADTGSVATAAGVAGTSRTRVYALRKADPAFASAWEDAEDVAVDRLQDEARRRALEGVAEPLVSAGKLVRDDNGQPITVQRYSDNLLIALLKARRPPRRERSVRLRLPTLESATDAPAAMASIAAAVSGGEITASEAAELSRVVEAFLKAIALSELGPRAAAKSKTFETWTTQDDGTLRSTTGECMTREAYDRLYPPGSPGVFHVSRVDAKL